MGTGDILLGVTVQWTRKPSGGGGGGGTLIVDSCYRHRVQPGRESHLGSQCDFTSFLFRDDVMTLFTNENELE